MSKPTAVIVLCEDLRQSSFTLKFLKKCGIERDKRDIRTIISPRGRGSAENWVLAQYPRQVNAYRIAKARKHTWLIVVVDADTGTVARRIAQMNEGLKRAEDQRLKELNVEDEKIARLIPRRNIETWILALNDVPVNEDEDYKQARSDEEWSALIPPASVALYNWTLLNGKLTNNLIHSLQHGIQEIGRIL